jgi:ABC-type amino acid transport substrate-binding protein
LKAIPTIESGLKMLRTKRIDAYIGPYSVIAEELQKLGMEHDIFHAGDIDQMQGNPYLSQKNRYLVEKFEQSLAEEIELDKKKEIDDQKKHSKKMD